MAITFDAASTSEFFSNLHSWEHVVGSGSDRLLIVGVSLYQDADAVIGITWGEQDFTYLASRVKAGAIRVELWYLKNPDVGTKDIDIETDWGRVTVGAASWFGVEQAGTFGAVATMATYSATISVDVSSAADELVIDVAGWHSNNVATVGGGQTQRWNRLGVPGTVHVGNAGSSEPGDTTVTMSWTLPASVNWATIGVPLRPAGAEVTVEPATLAIAATLHAPTVTTERNVTVTPSPLTITTTVHAPTIAISGEEVVVYPETLEIKATLHIPHLVIPYTEIPPFMQKDLIDPFASGAWLWLVEIAVPTQDVARIARNTEDVHYDGEDFEKFNIQIGAQIFSSDGSIPRVTLRTFQDISRKIENIINETEGALGGAVKLIRVNEKFLTSPVEALEADYDLLASESDSEWCTFTLGIPNPLTQRFPLRDYSSSMCPWTPPPLFKGPECQYPGDDPTCTGTYEDCYTKGNAEHWGGELGLSPSVIKGRER